MPVRDNGGSKPEKANGTEKEWGVCQGAHGTPLDKTTGDLEVEF